ncbi:MAG: nucleotidyltransferase, partial [Cyanobacteria bacterium J06628_3]
RKRLILLLQGVFRFLYQNGLVRGKIEFLEEAEQLYKLLTADIDFKGMLKQYPLPDEIIEKTQEFTNSRKDFIRLLQRSQRYHNALREWQAYQSWQKNRNPQRAETEKLSGYDLKHGMHCIRLLRSGLEILRQQEVIVDRKKIGDAEDLKAILRGEYSYEQLMQMAEGLVAEMDQVYEESTLRHKPDLEHINDLCIELVEMQGF